MEDRKIKSKIPNTTKILDVPILLPTVTSIVVENLELKSACLNSVNYPKWITSGYNKSTCTRVSQCSYKEFN